MGQKAKRVGFAVFGTFMAIPGVTFFAVFMSTARESNALGTFDLLASAFAAMTAFGAWTMARWTPWSYAGWASAVTCRQVILDYLVTQDVNLVPQAILVALHIGVTFLIYRKMDRYHRLRSDSLEPETTFY